MPTKTWFVINVVAFALAVLLLPLMLVFGDVILSTESYPVSVNVYNLSGPWDTICDTATLCVSTPTYVNTSSCAYIAADSNNCFFYCVWSNGQQSSSNWVGNVCPAVTGK